jgi:hypothetical protein
MLITLIGLFACLVTLLTLSHGITLPLPTEKISPALGFNAMLPVLMTVIGYLGIRAWQIARSDSIRQPILRKWLWTDLGYLALFVIATYFHFVLKLQIPLLRPVHYDPFFFAIDQYCLPFITALTKLRNGIAQWLPQPNRWYQLCQIGLYVFSFWGHSLGNRHFLQSLITAFLLNIMLGALAYLLAPAIGPFQYENGSNSSALKAQQIMAEVAVKVTRGGTVWLSLHGGQFFTCAPAAMPSLHVSIACIASYYAIRARLPLRFLILPMAAWIPLEAVASRWHYVVDLPAGALFATVVITLSNRLCSVPKHDGKTRLHPPSNKGKT